MAQRKTVRFIDDLDGSEASGTVDFGLDGRRYEIDLSEDNAGKLRDALAPFVGAARKSGSGRASTVIRCPSAAGFPSRSSRRTERRADRSARSAS